MTTPVFSSLWLVQTPQWEIRVLAADFAAAVEVARQRYGAEFKDTVFSPIKVELVYGQVWLTYPKVRS